MQLVYRYTAAAVRASAARFFAAAASFLGPTDTFALLLPVVRPFFAVGLCKLNAVDP
jgi:hypothetical protein